MHGPGDSAREDETPSTPQAAGEPTVLPMVRATVPVITTLVPPYSPVTKDGPSAAPHFPPVEETLVAHGERSVRNIALTFHACHIPQKPSGYDDRGSATTCLHRPSSPTGHEQAAARMPPGPSMTQTS